MRRNGKLVKKRDKHLRKRKAAISIDDLEKYTPEDLKRFTRDSVIVLDHDDVADPDEFWKEVERIVKQADQE